MKLRCYNQSQYDYEWLYKFRRWSLANYKWNSENYKWNSARIARTVKNCNQSSANHNQNWHECGLTHNRYELHFCR